MGKPPRRGKEILGKEEDGSLRQDSRYGNSREVWHLHERLMRVLIDTCVFIHLAIDREQLSDDVLSILTDYDNTICMSAETPRELIIQYNSGKLVSKYWRNAREMVDAIENDYYIHILPLKEEHMRTYSELEINKLQDHKDPSDHIIISHAITEQMPLISDDGKFEFYRKQGLDLILNKK